MTLVSVFSMETGKQKEGGRAGRCCSFVKIPQNSFLRRQTELYSSTQHPTRKQPGLAFWPTNHASCDRLNPLYESIEFDSY